MYALFCSLWSPNKKKLEQNFPCSTTSYCKCNSLMSPYILLLVDPLVSRPVCHIKRTGSYTSMLQSDHWFTFYISKNSSSKLGCLLLTSTQPSTAYRGNVWQIVARRGRGDKLLKILGGKHIYLGTPCTLLPSSACYISLSR